MRRLTPLLLCLAACAPDAVERPQPEVQPSADLLGGLGYTSWDPDAEEERSGVTLHTTEKSSPGVNPETT